MPLSDYSVTQIIRKGAIDQRLVTRDGWSHLHETDDVTYTWRV